jgi:thiol-disulfide isomerase/thioredoxin
MNTKLYFLLQVLLSSAYVIFRLFPPVGTDLTTLISYEFTSYIGLAIVLVLRLIRVDSWLGYFVFSIKLIHVLMFVLMCTSSFYWAACFGLAAIIFHFGVDPPFLEVSHRVATLREQLLMPYIERVPECFILFYTSWEGRCISTMPVFGDIAEKYTMKDRLFARFDLGRSPKMEKEYNVSATNGALNQLPTIIHFKNGKEVKRLNPALSPATLFNLPTIVKYFKLTLPPPDGGAKEK